MARRWKMKAFLRGHTSFKTELGDAGAAKIRYGYTVYAHIFDRYRYRKALAQVLSRLKPNSRHVLVKLLDGDKISKGRVLLLPVTCVEAPNPVEQLAWSLGEKSDAEERG